LAFAQPLYSARGASKSIPVRSGSGGVIGSAGDMNTAPRMRSPCSAASSSALPAAAQCPTRTQ
jgi:hypothetical protein